MYIFGFVSLLELLIFNRAYMALDFPLFVS